MSCTGLLPGMLNTRSCCGRESRSRWVEVNDGAVPSGLRTRMMKRSSRSEQASYTGAKALTRQRVKNHLHSVNIVKGETLTPIFISPIPCYLIYKRELEIGIFTRVPHFLKIITGIPPSLTKIPFYKAKLLRYHDFFA